MTYKIECSFELSFNDVDTPEEVVDIIRGNIRHHLGDPEHLMIKVYNDKKELENISTFVKNRYYEQIT